MSTTTDIEVQELDCRKNDGIHVALLWNSHTGRVSVAVEDERSGESFELEVDSADALTAITNPIVTPPNAPATTRAATNVQYVGASAQNNVPKVNPA